MTVPRHDWIGFRAGAETLDGGKTVGQFADVTLGMDSETSPGGFKLGMYVSAGASFEPSSLYVGATMPVTNMPSYELADIIGPPVSASTSTTTTSIYFTLGMTIGFG